MKTNGKLRVEDPDRQEAAQLIAQAPPGLRDRLAAALSGVLNKKLKVFPGQ
jgi:hypothetical protein